MQGRSPVLERKGPHKSMHCKFCKPPGAIIPEKASSPQLETKTRIHLTHEAADLRMSEVHHEPGVPAIESEACVCVLEGENSCSKCVLDKNVLPKKKKVCRCPQGSKPHPTLLDGAAPKEKKQKEGYHEFWWEKYSREYDAASKEMWTAYQAQRRTDKKLQKIQKLEQKKVLKLTEKGKLSWYQKLSCQQMMYVEFLSNAIRLDSDENITDRTSFILGGLGLYPRPSRKILKKCIRFCHYNAIQFLNQLYLLTKDNDPFREKMEVKGGFSWNERLIMNSMCHLEFPQILREIMDRLPPLPRVPLLPQIPYPVFPKVKKKKYDSPYEEPLWQDRQSWAEKEYIDRLNRCRAHMDSKRVKIPPLALVRRPSLIDARPPFLAQIEANERASRRMLKETKKKTTQKHHVFTFNSSVDVTAIADIEPSEISTIDKPDADEICVFLREPLKEPEVVEDELVSTDKEVHFEEVPSDELPFVSTEVTRHELDESSSDDDFPKGIPYITPPKTDSGTTIAQRCVPPESSPGPSATHYSIARRELDIINEESCGFQPLISTSTQGITNRNLNDDDVIIKQLISAADKLKEIAKKRKEEKEAKYFRKLKKKKYLTPCRLKRKRRKPTTKKKKKKAERRFFLHHYPYTEPLFGLPDKWEGWKYGEGKGSLNYEGGIGALLSEIAEGANRRALRKSVIKKESEISDPDPDYEDIWAARPNCLPEKKKSQEEIPKVVCQKRKVKRKKNSKKTKRMKNETKKKKRKSRMMELREECEDYFKKKEKKELEEKVTMTECYPGQFDGLYKDDQRRKEDGGGERKATIEMKVSGESRRQEGRVYKGNPLVLIKDILKDLAEEGYVCASYPQIENHPDIEQLILHLKGYILTKKKIKILILMTKARWAGMKGIPKFLIPELNVSPKKAAAVTWNDKKWLSALAEATKKEFYFKVASSRASFDRSLYKTLHQNLFGTTRFLKSFSAYMTSKFEDAILRGL